VIEFVVHGLLEESIRGNLLERQLLALNEKESLTKGNIQEAKCSLKS
jgi:hypothetical protein